MRKSFFSFLFLSVILALSVDNIFPEWDNNTNISDNTTSPSTAEAPKDETKYVGRFFDVQVPEGNYNFIKSVIAVFGNKFGKQPKTPQEEEEVVWDQLILSYEAFRRNIEVNQDEVDNEVSKILVSEKVDFDWKADKDAYAKWLRQKTGEQPDLFANQIKHLIQVQRLREKVMSEMEPTVTDEEAFQGFLNENSSLDVELVKFDDEKDAVSFYDKVKASPEEWEKEKAKRPKDFRRPGGVTCQFLIEFWKIPSKAQLEMVKMKPGEFHKPEPIYKGWGVFKVMGSTAADETKFNDLKERYYEKVKIGKRYEGLEKWFENLKKEADIKVFPLDERTEKPLEKIEERGGKNG